ncbi:MAG: SHOCT domain-containing protein [Chlorobi bacterium]|nr:SHOCT domain-containing protein [Chlorobiota bacterium]
MWTEHSWMGGMWIFPFILLIIALFVVLAVFGRGGFTPPWSHDKRNHHDKEQNGTAIEILKKRYASGEISKDEFDKIKRDIS